MNLEKIEKNLEKLVQDFKKENFIYDFLLAFDQPKATINRLKKGTYNLSNKNYELIWKKKIYFYQVSDKEDVHNIIDELSKDSETKKNKIRFLIVTDFKNFLSKDLKTNDSLDIKLTKLSENIGFFLPLLGREKMNLEIENPADIKAANQMGNLYDQILKDNQNYDLNKHRGHLNLFFTRLLFLYYADDSEIFKKNQFLNVISNFTNEDGADLSVFFNSLFYTLDNQIRDNLPNYLKEFPYVNGNLFNGKINLPNFTKITRQMIIKGATLDWHMINPDILGSMLQAVVSIEEREEDEMHYTSVSNILKVIGPLFLDDLKEKIEIADKDEKKLKTILKFIYNLKIFDPACGSGNFLIIAYKQLCFLEIKIFEKLLEINSEDWKMSVSGISLNQFYGIEKSNYATETSKLSLWLAEHQMNLSFKEIFGTIKPALPLSETGKIKCDNSINVDWDKFCQYEKKTSHIYIIGNPPFKSFSERNNSQQEDVIKILNKKTKMDYVGLWFIKGSDFINKIVNSSLALVSTNSINQGEQVNLLWSIIFKHNIEIIFAHKSVKWKNNARGNGGVTVSIIGLKRVSNIKKKLYIKDQEFICKNINPYLINSEAKFVIKRRNSLSNLPKMTLGDMAKDGGNLVLDKQEYLDIIKVNQDYKKFFKRFIGGTDFINNTERWCIWCDERLYKECKDIPFFLDRFKKVENSRKNSKKEATAIHSKTPYKFVEIRKKFVDALIVPIVSSESREYFPVGFVNKDFIMTATLQVIYQPDLYLFSIISSRMHRLWGQIVGGGLETRISYSSELIYNTFPIQNLDIVKKKKLSSLALAVMDEREKDSEKNISDLYDPNKMPLGLKNLHQKIDQEVELCYKTNDISSDNERIEILFNLYENMKNMKNMENMENKLLI